MKFIMSKLFRHLDVNARRNKNRNDNMGLTQESGPEIWEE